MSNLTKSRILAHVDRPLLACVFAIITLGLYNLSSASRPLGESLHYTQGLYMAIGCVIALALASVHYRHLEGLAIPIFVGAVVLLLATGAFGRVVNGSRRWLSFGFVNFQTSDAAKLAVLIVVAKIFHTERWEGGLTLQEVFRPLNISRPVILLVVVLVLAMFGDRVAAPALQEPVGNRYRSAVVLRGGDGTTMIGRAPKGTPSLELRLSGVAREHAQIVRVGRGEYLLKDLAPDKGTFVNDVRIDHEQRLNHGDLVRFGVNPRALFRFKHPLGPLRSALPWAALIGAAWLFAAVFLQLRKRAWSFSDVFAPIDFVALPAGLVLIQPDLGTSLLIGLVAFTMILYVGVKPLSLVILGISGVLAGILAWVAVLKPYQKERVLTFLNPTSDLAGAGYHQHQSVIAVGSGELFGKGYGQGTQTQLSFLPEQQTDFIFSVWSEEHGFLGSALVVVLFAMLVLLAMRVAAQARDRFGALLAVGVAAMVFWHASINMLMVLRLAPVVGVPLPLFSNGGSFSVTMLAGLGLLLNVSARRNLF
ncbi:MAG: FtsW/RodA/SpoVE family cell cycle protein [Deltaproteobacteria bacterium]|nr:FtsW/RodA/SpoVE family cell cycle protein [Deltaproteobacteria bacterium]